MVRLTPQRRRPKLAEREDVVGSRLLSPQLLTLGVEFHTYPRKSRIGWGSPLTSGAKRYVPKTAADLTAARKGSLDAGKPSRNRCPVRGAGRLRDPDNCCGGDSSRNGESDLVHSHTGQPPGGWRHDQADRQSDPGRHLPVSATPTVAGLPKTERCASGGISAAVELAADNGHARTVTFKIRALGSGKSALRLLRVHQAASPGAATPPAAATTTTSSSPTTVAPPPTGPTTVSTFTSATIPIAPAQSTTTTPDPIAAESAHVDLVSFTSGCPTLEIIDRLHRANVGVAVTITSVVEAQIAADRGTDLLAMQGTEAGGHQGSFADLAANHRPLLELLADIREVTDVAMIGAGGVMTGRDAGAVLGAGAIAVQLGTALLCTPEAGTSALYRQALLALRYPDTILTRAYSGRFARGLANRFALEHDSQAPQAYPEVHHLTRPLRSAATNFGDDSVPNLWAGTGWRQLTVEPAATIVRRIAADAQRAGS
jgi:NAD(P)H-dependent flavin oxidoreductase YrpB (nitropropane dioxygenase family)